MRARILVMALIMVVCLPTLVVGQVVEGVRMGQGPIKITSRNLEARHKERMVIFSGDVIARQEQFALYADHLTVYLKKEVEDIDRIVAKDNVRIVQGNRLATCREAVYYHSEGTLILQGDPMVREGDSSVRGWRIVYYVNGEKSVVEGKDDQRVSVTIVPGGEKKNR